MSCSTTGRGGKPPALLGHHSAAFTLATYMRALPGDLPEPSFADAILATDTPEGGDTAETGRAVEVGEQAI